MINIKGTKAYSICITSSVSQKAAQRKGGKGGRGEGGKGGRGEGGKERRGKGRREEGEKGEGGRGEGGRGVEGIKRGRGWGSRELQNAKAEAQTRSEQLPCTRVLVKACSSKHG